MAALTSDRIGVPHKLNPREINHSFELGASQTVWADSLLYVASDGKAYNMNTALGGKTVTAVLYSKYRLSLDTPSPGMHVGAGNTPVCNAQSGMEVYLTGTGTLTAADEGKVAYASDDQTFNVTSGIAPIGRVTKVLSATYAQVLVDGKTRDVYIDTIA